MGIKRENSCGYTFRNFQDDDEVCSDNSIGDLLGWHFNHQWYTIGTSSGQ